MNSLPLEDFHPATLFDLLRRGHVEPRQVSEQCGRMFLTEAGMSVVGTLAHARRPEIRLDAVSRSRLVRFWHLRQSLRYCPCCGVEIEDTRRARRRERLHTLLVRAGAGDLLVDPRDDQNWRSCSVHVLGTRHGPALILEESRVTGANTHASEFVVECRGHIFVGHGDYDVAGEVYLELAGIFVASSPWLELVGEEYAGDTDRFIGFALDHLFSGTVPGPDHGLPLARCQEAEEYFGDVREMVRLNHGID